MKTLEWHDFFEEQRSLHGKVAFTVAELANAARTDLHAVNTELGRLLSRGMIARYAHGVYGPAQDVRPEEILPEIDSAAYVTGFFALYRRHLVTQFPMQVTCFTNRRHNRKAQRETPAGQLKFVQVKSAIYSPPAKGVLASAEQALCDFSWLSLKDGVQPISLVTFRNLDRLNLRRLKAVLRRYPESVSEAVATICGIEVGSLVQTRTTVPFAADA